METGKDVNDADMGSISYEIDIHVLHGKVPFGRFKYTLSESGVLLELVSKNIKKLNRIGTIAGIILGKPEVAGAGMISTSRENTLVKWKNVSKAVLNEKEKKITLKDGLLAMMDIYCTDENYNQVAKYVKSRTAH